MAENDKKFFLEKLNETIWAIKRREHPGKFILKSTENNGRVINVSIALNDGEAEVVFNMKYTEFNNFFGILSSFKELVESPEHLALNESMHEEVPILGPKEPTLRRITISKPKTFTAPKSTKDLDLEAITATLDQINSEKMPQISIPDLSRRSQSPTAANSQNPPQKVAEATTNIPNNKKRLKKTDWDPW